MNRHRAHRRHALAATATLLLTVAGCGSSSEGVSDVSTTSTVAAAPASTEPMATTEKKFMPCSEAVILGEVFDEDMVAECMQISGVASVTCDDGAVIGLIDVTGTPLIVQPGSSAEPVDDTVAAKLNDAPPFRYDVDQSKLLDRCE